jgi:hypothetical protein
VIDNFKYDLKMQREVWNAINNLDRPYKKGIPGIDTNLYPSGPTKPKLQDLGFPRQDPDNNIFYTFANEDRFIANTPFHAVFDFKHIKEWENERRNRRVSKHFSDKGSKYDIEIKPEEKFEYVADRLGHPEFIGTPFEWLLRLESDIYHPCYLDQPFVRQPSPTPHPSLNFEQGEVLYENTKILEWVKLLQLSVLSLGVFGGGWVPFNLMAKTNLVTDAADDLGIFPYHLVSPHNIDILKLSVPILTGSSFYVVYLLLNCPNVYLSNYVVKMTYSKDKVLQSNLVTALC